MTQAPYFPLPLEVDEISSDWLTRALRQRHPNVTVLQHEVLETIRTTTTKVRIRLQLDAAGQQAGILPQIIVKGGFEAHGRELEKMHLREVRGYRDVFPRVPLHTPACYFADFDFEQRQGIVIMEDLSLRQVSFCHATQPQTYDQAARRLTALARFHAETWNSPELSIGGQWADLVDFFAVMDRFFDKYTSPEHWQRFMEKPRGVATSFRFRDRRWMRESWRRVTRFGQQLPQCVLHGDVHLGNLYFEADGTPGFLDTLASKGPAMLEVAYFLSASLDSADRPLWETDLVSHYLHELRECGVKPPSLTDAMQQYVLFLIYGLFIWQTTESSYQPEIVNTANVARVSAAMVEHNSVGLIDALPC